MKVEEFLRQYKFASKARESEEKFLQERMVRDYVPYVQKIAVCNSIVNACYYRVEARDKNGIATRKSFHIDSPNGYLFFVLSLIKSYTDIEVLNVNDDFANQYDMLNQSGLILVLIKRIPKSEYEQFKMVYDMVQSDTFKNEYEIDSWISKKIDTLGRIIGESIEPIMNNMGITFEDIKNLITTPEIQKVLAGIEE